MIISVPSQTASWPRTLVRRLLTVGIAASLGTPGSVRATTYIWDGGGANGNWLTAANWQGNAVPPSSQDTALIFTGNSELASIQNAAGIFSLNSLSFDGNAGAFTLSGSQLDFSTSSSAAGSLTPTLVQNSANLETINNPLRFDGILTVSGSGNLLLGGTIQLGNSATQGLTMAGSGTLTLTGNSNGIYNGTTILQSGVLDVSSAGALGGSGTIAFTGGTLQYSATNQTDYSNRFSQAASQAYNIDTNGQSVTFGRALTSSRGSLTKLGAGTLTLTGANTYTGTTTVSAGTLAVGTGGGISSGNSGLYVQTGGTFALSGTGTVSSLNETVGANSPGTFTQSGGTNTIASDLVIGSGNGNGTYNLNAGMLSTSAESIASDSDTGTFNQSGGTNTVNDDLFVGGTGVGSYNQSGGTNTVNDYLYVGFNGNGTYNLSGGSLAVSVNQVVLIGENSGATGSFTLSNAASLSAGDLIVGDAGQGTFTQGGTSTVSAVYVHLNGANSSQVDTYNLNGGTLTTGSVFSPATNSVFNFAGGTLQASGSDTNQSTPFFQSAGTANVSSGSTAIIDTQSYSVSVASPLSGAGSLTKLGNGTLTLTAANTYTGTTTISAGTLQVGSGGTSGSLGTSTITDSGTLAFNRSDNVSVANAIGGTGSLTQLGGGTLTLTGANTYKGATTVSAGTLQVGSGSTSGSLGTGAITDNGTLDFNRSDNVSVANTVGGTGGLTQLGGGTLTLTGANTYTGMTTVSAGVLNLANALALQNSTLTLSSAAGSGTLSFDSSVSSKAFVLGGLSGDSNLVLANNAATPAAVALSVGNNGASTTYTGVLSGAGSLTKLGSGTLTLTGANTYAGPTTVSAGTLDLANALALQYSTLALGGGTVSFDASVSANAFTLGGLSGSGNLVLANNASTPAAVALSVGTGNSNTPYAGNLSGPGSLTVQGYFGTLTLTGTNTYTGGTILTDGATLNLGSAGALGSTGTITFNGGILQFSTANTSDYSARFSQAANQYYYFDTNGQNVTFATGLTSNGGTLSVGPYNGGGTLTLTGTNTYTGATYVYAGTLQVGSGGSLGATDITVYGGAAFNLTGTGVLTGASNNLTLNGYSGTPATVSLSSTGTSSRGSVTVGNTSGGVGILTQSAGTLNVSASSGSAFVLGYNAGSSGTYNLGGGSLSTGQAYVGRSGTGTFNQTGGSFTTNNQPLILGFANGSSGTYNLSGGTLTTGEILPIVGNFSFNGGTLQAASSTTSFFDNYAKTANVQAGAIIDTQSYNVTVGQNLTSGVTNGTDGGLTKLGVGALTLTGANTFTGATIISAGVLNLGCVHNTIAVRARLVQLEEWTTNGFYI